MPVFKKNLICALNQLLYGVKYIDNGGQNGQKSRPIDRRISLKKKGEIY
jgi:hypothetical protein